MKLQVGVLTDSYDTYYGSGIECSGAYIPCDNLYSSMWSDRTNISTEIVVHMTYARIYVAMYIA